MTRQEWKNKLAAPQPGLANGVSSGASSGVNSFLAWLMLWFKLCLKRTQAQSRETVRRAYQPNRHWRRLGGRKIPPTRDNRPYYIFSRRDLTPTQFMERLVALSGRGRVSVYRMRYWRKTVKGKAAPLGTEHEYWRDPFGCIGKRMGKLSVGVWHGHLWPGWRALFCNVNILTPAKTSWVDNVPCPHIVCGFNGSSQHFNI